MLMKRNRSGIKAKHLLSFLTALCLFVSAIPAAAQENAVYGMTTAKDVFFRAYPSTASNVVWYDKLPQNWVAKILGTSEKNGVKWYHVETGTQENPGSVKGGYIHADFFRELTSEETAAWNKNPVQLLWLSALKPATPTPSPKPNETAQPGPTYMPGEDGPGESYKTGFILITKARVNFRDAVEGSTMGQLDKGTILPYYGVEISRGQYKWIYALHTQSQQYGYVRSDCYKFVTEEGEVTEGPGWQTPGPYNPGAPITPGSYAMCTMPAANLRQTPNGYALTAVPKDAVLKILGQETSGWYPVSYNGFSGYIQKEFIRMMTGAEIAEYLSGQGNVPSVPTSSPGGSNAFGDGYVQITAQRVNLRSGPNGSSILQMEKNSVVPYFGAPQYAGGVNWLYVYYPPANMYGYVHEDFYRYTDYAGNPVSPGATATPHPETVSGYVKLILPGVNLRETPGGRSQTQLGKGTILPYQGGEQYYGGYRWVFVTDPASRITGYVRSDCYQFTDSAGNPAPAPSAPVPVPPTNAPVPPSQNAGLLQLIKGGVNLRETPAGRVIGRLDRGTQLNFYNVAYAGGYTWYYVYSEKGAGYLRSDMIKILSNPSEPLPTESINQTGINGYLITTKTRVNLRNTPAGKTLIQVPKGKVYPITGPIVSQSGYNWSFVEAEGHTGYLRSDCVRHLSKSEIDDYLNGVMPSIQGPSGPDYQASGSIILLDNYVNIRVAPSLDSQKIGQVNKGTVLPYFSTVSSGGNSWFYIQYAGTRAYLMAKYARIMSLEEQENTGGVIVPTATPSATLNPDDMSNIAVTIMDRVKLRSAGNMSSSTRTLIYKAGTRLTLLGDTNATQDGYFWYSARANSVNGWIRADMIRILSKEEAGTDTGAPDIPGDKPTATYRTLRLGMSGDDVTRLQNMLIALGLMPNGTATGVYDTRTEQAVRQYQKLEGLFVDGVAGQNTQNALYNTQSPNPGGPDGGTVDTKLYPVEMVDWYRGDIQSVWGKGETAVVTDVRTGLSFRARRWSGGYHADVEPLTAADTEVICRIYGVKNAQEISEKNMWQRRPLWITLKGRTFAASMYGVPHNYPAGDTIPNNNYNGQFCVHFLNSRTHASNRVDENHMNAIREAYDKAPSKK